jgi:hypothetical protein
MAMQLIFCGVFLGGGNRQVSRGVTVLFFIELGSSITFLKDSCDIGGSHGRELEFGGMFVSYI